MRGDAISGNRPAAILDLSYDDPSGLYLGGSAIGALDRGHDPALLGAIGNVGYATRIGARLSIDAGYMRTQYAHYAGAAHGYAHYDEVYAGLSAYGLSAHVHVSPDYLRRDVSTVYGELDGALKPIGAWRLTAHAGVLGHLAQPRGLALRTRYDWRIGVARPIGPFNLFGTLTGGGPDSGCCRSHAYGRTALIGGVSLTF